MKFITVLLNIAVIIVAVFGSAEDEPAEDVVVPEGGQATKGKASYNTAVNDLCAMHEVKDPSGEGDETITCHSFIAQLFGLQVVVSKNVMKSMKPLKTDDNAIDLETLKYSDIGSHIFSLCQNYGISQVGKCQSFIAELWGLSQTRPAFNEFERKFATIPFKQTTVVTPQGEQQKDVRDIPDNLVFYVKDAPVDFDPETVSGHIFQSCGAGEDCCQMFVNSINMQITLGDAGDKLKEACDQGLGETSLCGIKDGVIEFMPELGDQGAWVCVNGIKISNKEDILKNLQFADGRTDENIQKRWIEEYENCDKIYPRTKDGREQTVGPYRIYLSHKGADDQQIDCNSVTEF